MHSDTTYKPLYILKALFSIVAAGLVFGGILIFSFANPQLNVSVFSAEKAYAGVENTDLMQCPFDSDEDTTVVSFNERIGFNDRAKTSKQQVNLSAGTYEVSLYGYDAYQRRVNVAQPDERWKVAFLSRSDALITTSGTSDDLDDNTATATHTTLVNSKLEISQDVRHVRGYHAVYTKDSNQANSLNAVCASFTQIDTNEKPTATNDYATTTADKAVEIDVLANDTDPDGDSLSIESFTQPSNGNTATSSSGIAYTPDTGFTGQDSFAYKVSDGNDGYDIATATIAVQGAKQHNGSIRVCKVISNDDGEIVSGSANAGEFDISLYEDNKKSEIFDTAHFKTPLDYTNDALATNGESNDIACHTFDNLPLGDYYYDEENINGNSWQAPEYNDQFKSKANTLDDFHPYNSQLFDNNPHNDSDRDKDADGHIILNKNRSERTLIVHNSYKKEARETATLVASKVVCEDESQLPNWSGDDIAIGSTTAQSWADNRDGCHLASDWEFQWNVGSAANPGDNQGTVQGWNTFGPTDEDGIASTTISEDTLISTNKIWVREGPQDGYEEFSGVEGGDMSAEMWCHTDVLNYDNYDFIKNPEASNTYYCTAFNALEEGENRSPNAADDTASTTQDTPVTIDVLANDTDPDGDSLSISKITSPGDGSAATTTGGEIEYTPDAGFLGNDTFSYTLSDGRGGTDTATVTISVASPGFSCEDLEGASGWYGEYYNYPQSHPDMELPRSQWDTTYGDPLGDESSWQTDWYNEPFFGFVRIDNDLAFGGNFFPFGADDYHFGAHWRAEVTASSSGAYQYSLTSDDDAWVYVDGDLRVDNSGVHPPKTKSGTIQLSAGTHQVDVFFAERHTVQSYLSFEFTGANLSTHPFAPQCGEQEDTDPTATNDSATTTEGTAVDIDVLANDTDPDGDTLSILAITNPSDGTAATTTSGSIRYTPDADFVGDDSFEYTIIDEDNATSSAQVNISVQEKNDGNGGGADERQCNDGIDNDGDGLVDAEDPGCHTDRDPNDDDDTYNPEDDSEEQAPQCSDDVDNDGDMHVDEQDDGCHTDGDADDGDNTYDPDYDSENRKPVINIIGANPQTVTRGNTYNDPGAMASDPEEGDLTDEIVASSSVNTNTVGTYTVSYNVTDSQGASADEKTRTVKVTARSGGNGGSGDTGGSGGGGGGFNLQISNESAEPGDQGGTAVVSWNTNTEATSRVVYGTSSISDTEVDEDEEDYGYEAGADEVDEDTEDHEMTISGLEEGVTYYFRPVSDTSFTGEEIGDEVSLRFGQIAGAEQTDGGTVSSASTQCTPYLDDFLKHGENNDRLEVLKLQAFLVAMEGYDAVELTGDFDQATFEAVEDFQMRYASDVLTPWGYAEGNPTGYVYITTRNKINEIVCNTEYPFSSGQEQEIREYRRMMQQSNGESRSSGEDSVSTSDGNEEINAVDGESSPGMAVDENGSRAATTTATASPQRSAAAAIATGVYTTLDGAIQPVANALISLEFLFLLIGILIGWELADYMREREWRSQEEIAY